MLVSMTMAFPVFSSMTRIRLSSYGHFFPAPFPVNMIVWSLVNVPRFRHAPFLDPVLRVNFKPCNELHAIVTEFPELRIVVVALVECRRVALQLHTAITSL